MAEQEISLPEVVVDTPKPQAPATPTVPSLVGAPAPTTPAPAPSPEPQGPPMPRSETARVYVHPTDPASKPSPVVRAVDMMKPLPMEPAVPVPVTNGVWEPELERSALSTGVDVNLMRRIAGKESNNDPNARASTSSAAGIFQFIKPTWDDLATRYGRLGLTNRMDPAQQARVAPYYMKEINEGLERVLGRKPTAGESYLGWFLGPGDAQIAMKASPDTPIGMVVNPASIAANPKVFANVRTVGDLYRWSDGKMGGAGTAEHPAPRIDLTPYLAPGHGKEHVDGMQWGLKSGLANMIADMPPELRAQLKINSGFRSPERQAELFKEAVAKYGSEEAARKWVAPPGNSQHNHGNAADLGFGNDAVKQWVHTNAGKYGLGFPMGHEPWHIESLDARSAKLASYGVPRSYDPGGRQIPFTRQDQIDQERKRNDQAYTLTQAAAASATQDWMISNMLKSEGKVIYDPDFKVTKEALGSDRVKALPENYLPYLTEARSQHDYDHRLQKAEQDFERERRLDATPYGGMVRFATSMADPAGIALGAIAPFGFAAKLGQLGKAARLGVSAADGATGAFLSEVPAIMHRPGYEPEQAMYATALGTVGYLALNRHAWKDHPAAPEMEEAITGMAKLKSELESGVALQDSSVGAATVKGYREAVRDDVAGLNGIVTEKSGASWMDKIRFDVAKLKNSDNSLVAKATDLLVQDTVGNRDKSKAVTRPIEYDARIMEEKANIQFARIYQEASADYRKRNGISMLDWQRGGEEEFQKLAGRAARNTDPTQSFDPAVEKVVGGWRNTSEFFHQRAINPGLERGETLPSLPGAESWDPKTYVPRYTNWDQWNVHNAEFGGGLKQLFTEAIARKNPDLDYGIAKKAGEAYYKRLASVEAGQELNAQRAISGTDLEAMRKMLQDANLSHEEIEKLLYQADAKASEGKTLTSRQKRRTLMDENFSMTLEGRSGSREVKVGDIWEDNLRSIQHAYSKQMSGTIALANFRVENPQWHATKNPDVPRFIVDGIHSEGDWNKFLSQIRAHDNEIRYGDRLATVEGEIKQLQWVFDTLRGVPQSMDRTKLGQFLRVVQNVNFIRLMSQAGWASVAEFGNLLGNVGLRHMFTSMPSVREVFNDIYRGKLPKDELLDLERTFTAGTDHLRGTGMTWGGADVASSMNDSSKLSARLDAAEKFTKKGARYTSMVSLAPLTTFQEQWALQAALSKFKGAALRGEKLNEQRMRLIGLDAEMQGRVLKEIEAHNGTKVIGERGNEIETLGLDKWDPQVRSAFEYAVNTWVRRIIQQNDLGQMNAMLGTTLGKVLFQFRNFTLGAWSKQTLSSLHMRDMNAMTGFMASMLFGSMAFAVQRSLGALGLPEEERQKTMEKELAPGRLVAAAIQRAGHSSLLPGAADFGLGMLGFDPFFDTRSTQQPTQGWAANPTTGLIDAVYSASRSAGRALHDDEEYTSKDFRNLSRAVNVFHNYPIMMQMMNGASNAFPSP